jgi:hypothetical protein
MTCFRLQPEAMKKQNCHTSPNECVQVGKHRGTEEEREQKLKKRE